MKPESKPESKITWCGLCGRIGPIIQIKDIPEHIVPVSTKNQRIIEKAVEKFGENPDVKALVESIH